MPLVPKVARTEAPSQLNAESFKSPQVWFPATPDNEFETLTV